MFFLIACLIENGRLIERWGNVLEVDLLNVPSLITGEGHFIKELCQVHKVSKTSGIPRPSRVEHLRALGTTSAAFHAASADLESVRLVNS